MTYQDPAYATPAPYPFAPPAAPPRTNVLAIISFVAAFVVPIAAIVIGHISMSQLRTSGEQGRGLAIAGLVLGYVFTAFTVLFVILWFALVFGAIATHGFSGTQA
jgi:Domain of unknown function (DUF4190)